MRVEVASGAGTIAVETPKGLEVEVPPEPAPKTEPAAAAAARALAAPSGSAALETRAAGVQDAVVAVPDGTRSCPTAEVLPLLVEPLLRAGIPGDRIRVLIATGMHRPPSATESAALLGAAAGRGIVVEAHNARGAIRDNGSGPQGAPMRVAEVVAAAGFVLSLGVVEPHAFAGFSGGWKTVGIGCAGEETIAFTHAPRFLDHPRCRPGVVDGNPFAEVVRENARRAGHRFALNLVLAPGGGVVAAAAGDPGVVHRLLLARAREASALPVRGPADVVLAGVGAPKDANLYQASRAATNLLLGSVDCVRPGGTVIVVASCPEGVGAGEGEKRFAESLRRGPEAVRADRERAFHAGEQRAWAVAKALSTRKIVIAGSKIPAADLAAMGLGSAASAEEALAAAVAAGARRLLVVRRAVEVLAVPAGSRP